MSFPAGRDCNAQFEDASVEFGWHSVSAAGSMALVAADVILHLKTSDREMSEQIRLTVALERRGNKWLIVQWHDSLPAAGQKDGQAFAT
ncbi:nuclear transport factor 2 family protein [Chloroflexota bacterium]